MVRPVATPMAKLMPNSIPQYWVMSRQIRRPVMTKTLSMIASSTESPSVSGTNRKWYIAVRANCRRDRSTAAESIMGGLGRVSRRGRHQMAEHGNGARLHAVRRTEAQEIDEREAERLQRQHGRNLAPVLRPVVRHSGRAGTNVHDLSAALPVGVPLQGSQ